MAKKLVIVESPAKARSLSGFLGPGFQVLASVGHIRDLPQPSDLPATMKKGPYGKFAVNVAGDFEPYYVVYPEKKKTVTELRKALKEADELFLATDEDREGEAIAWHLLEVLKPKVPVRRMVFHEITADAIKAAVANTRDINEHLVDAQETRRILDRLVGYEVSPLLWRKIGPGLSAGRVQSVATRLVVDRERERMAFRAASYWDVTASLQAAASFQARLSTLDGARVATGKDFSDSGELKSGRVHLDEAAARSIADGVRAAGAAGDVTVAAVDSKPHTRRPAAPFTTSTLQQEASRKLRMNVARTMRVAQALYENGFITYMRTDSTALSAQAIAAARAQASQLYGADSIPAAPRTYGKINKGAQEAHEAIRPAGETFRLPSQTGLVGEQAALYDLIWKRTLASQMTDAVGHTDTVRIQASLPTGVLAGLTASGTVITHRGFLAAYEEGKDAKQYEKGESEGVRLPELAAGDVLAVQDAVAAGHETTPPPRYTEASLVKALETRQIGRPSTYAAIIETIGRRDYVTKKGQALVPSWLAFSVTRLLEQNLTRLVDYDFTASMETELDEIAAGTRDRVQWLRHFYLGPNTGLKPLVDGLGDIDARAVNTIEVGDGISLRVGRYGPYLESEKDGELKRASVPEDVAPDELTAQKAAELLAQPADEGRELGPDPATGHQIIAKSGRFGPYVTEVLEEGSKKKPRTASLFKSMQLETIGLEDALQLLSLPRLVGSLDGVEVTAQNGRYGPYLKKGTDSRSLEGEEQLFTVSIAEAEALFAAPKQRRGAAAPLRELGADPVSGKAVTVKDGRFGPYVTDGVTNATLRKADDPVTVTPERAYELLAEKRAKGPAAKRTRVARKAPAKKATAKKAPAKTAVAKKATAKGAE